MEKKQKLTQRDSLSIKLLNAEQIAIRRIPVDDAEITVRGQNKWHCSFCNKRFVHENSFLGHQCEPRRRIEELKSPLGQAAYGFYRDWMRLKKHSQPGADAFLESKFYRTFINFAQLVVDANISRPDKFMELMIEAEVAPVLWCREQCYALYLEWTDKMSDPLDEVQQSLNYLFDICDKEEVGIKTIFNHLGPQRVLSLVRQRRLTPWLLFCSPSFGAFLRTIDKTQLKVFNAVVNASYWGNRFQTERAIIANIKTIINELEL